jgi:hypothetical protein
MTLAYLVWFPPAILGAAFSWSRWLNVALLIPGLLVYAASQGAARYREIHAADPTAPIGQRIPALWFSSYFGVVIVFAPARLVAVLVVPGFLLVDLAWWWRSRRRSTKHSELAL